MGRIKESALRQAETLRVQVQLGNLPDSVPGIFCWCNRCGHNAVVAIAVLIAQFGPGCAVPEIGARMRCSGCGSKDVATRPDWPSLGQVTQHVAGAPSRPEISPDSPPAMG